MTAVAFDTLKLARKLRDSAEMSQVQAEGVADALAEAMSGAELATKGDVENAKTELKRDIRELELKVDGRFEAILERIDRRAAESDARMMRFVGGAMATSVLVILGAIWAAVRYLPGMLH